MSLDFQVASLSYKSSSFATSRGNEKIGGTGYCVTYDTDSQSRNADFISIAAERQSTTLGPKAVKLKNPWAEGPSILRTFPFTTLLHNPPPSGGHNPRAVGPSTFPSEPFEPFEPSRRRRVQRCVPWRSSCHNLRITLKPSLGRLFFIYTGQS